MDEDIFEGVDFACEGPTVMASIPSIKLPPIAPTCPFGRDNCYGQCSECEHVNAYAGGPLTYIHVSAPETKRTEDGVTITERPADKPLYYRNGKLTDKPAKPPRDYRPGHIGQ